MNCRLMDAINRSIMHNECVTVEVISIPDAIDTLTELWNDDLDYCRHADETEDGDEIVDVWGWTEAPSENEQGWQGWRINLVAPRAVT